ncbi:MAG TPA: glycyl-radical enzyme activating protein [Chloroflexi bacterium]|nr:glycyl-radical enzyme activating protein [Chloroflexota bacterium]
MSHGILGDVRGTLFDMDTFAIHDGPGIRLTVYLKGCPLTCAWCHSPESQSPAAQLVLVRDRCVGCGACVAACPQGVHRVTPGAHTLERSRCRTCGACVAACPGGALTIKGYEATAAEVVARAVRMKPFFAHSGGGVTLTGGEVTMQPAFAHAVLAGCRAEGIHTAIETCGACAWPTLERLADVADLILYDIKLVDEAAHRRWTGRSNRRILENATRLAGRNVQVRVPLIPGITDTEENLGAIVALMRSAGLRSVALLPYNEASAAKYEWLDRPYALTAARQTPAQLEALLAIARRAGLDAELG